MIYMQEFWVQLLAPHGTLSTKPGAFLVMVPNSLKIRKSKELKTEENFKKYDPRKIIPQKKVQSVEVDNGGGGHT